MELFDLRLLIADIIFLTFSFEGLLGAIHRRFVQAADLFSFEEYRNRRALVWGVLFSIAFSLIPIVHFIEVLQNKQVNPQGKVVVISLLVVISLSIAILLRRYKVYERLMRAQTYFYRKFRKNPWAKISKQELVKETKKL